MPTKKKRRVVVEDLFWIKVAKQRESTFNKSKAILHEDAWIS